MKRRDHDRIGRLYDRFAAPLYRYALMILAEPGGAADAVQQVFVTLLSTDANLSAVNDEAGYLRRAVRNECFTALRRRRRSVITDAPLLESVAAATDCPDERLAIERVLRDLPPEQREVVHLKIFEGWTFQAIADLSGESINTIASRYRYAIEKMRAQLGERSGRHE